MVNDVLILECHIDGSSMVDVKCKGCNKLLAKVDNLQGAIKCSRCYMIFEYNVKTNELFVTNEFDMKNVSVIMQPESSKRP